MEDDSALKFQYSQEMASPKNRTQTRNLTQDLRKNGHLKKRTVPKTRTQGLKTLPFVSCHFKDNVKVIYFYIKSRGVQGLIFVQIPFEKYTTHFYFENGEVGVKTTITNLQPLLARKISGYLRILM